jgi:hypothetical protein
MTDQTQLQVGLFTKSKGIVTKHLSLDDRGRLVKDGTQCRIGKAQYESVPIADLHDFNELLDGLTYNQALCYGRTTKTKSLVVSKKNLPKYPDAITRTADQFFFKGKTILMLDYDPHSSDVPLAKEELRDILVEIAPQLEQVKMLWRPSASSCVWHGNKEIMGISGQRLYFVVDNGDLIPYLTKYLTTKLWLAGYGYIAISRAGSLLARTTFDGGVWSAEHLDFAAGAWCEEPLERRPVPGHIFPGSKNFLKITDGFDLSADEERQAADLIHAAKESEKDEQKHVIEQYVHNRARELAGQSATAEEIAVHEEALKSAATTSILTSDFVVHLDDYGPTTIAEILNNKEKYNGKSLADPLEWDYGASAGESVARNKAKLFLIGTRPNINSMAHGGRNYRLSIRTNHIQIHPGGMDEELEEIGEVLHREPDIFMNDAGLVFVASTGMDRIPKVQLMNTETLTCRVASLCRFYSVKVNQDGSTKEIDQDPPARLMQLLAKRDDKFRIRYLENVITAPTLLPDGTILQKPGYHEETRTLLFYDEPKEVPIIPEFPTRDEVTDAYETLWEPFSQFNYASELDKAVMLSAILTAVIRKRLPTAPAVIVSATSAGSGKTKIAQCLEILAGGEGATNSMPNDGEELRKALTGTMLAGAPSIIYDNLTRPVQGDLLCAVVTSPIHSDRVLGTKDKVQLSTRMMFIFTGNNLHAAGDMARRSLRIQLDPECENPWQRDFDFDPVAVVRKKRMEMVSAALTIVRGFLTDEYLGETEGLVTSHTGSYEEWSRLIRQTVIWLGHSDPNAALEDNHENDPETALLHEMMSAWHDCYGTEPVSNQQLAVLLKTKGMDTAQESRLYDSILEAMPYGAITTVSFGKWLGLRTGRIVKGFKFVKYRHINDRGTRLVSTGKPKIVDDLFDPDDFFN